MDYSALSSDEEYSIPIVNKPPLENFNSFFFVVIFFAVRFLEFFLLDLGTSTFNEILVVANTIDIYQEILFP